ncbi:hypothetical protein, conserved [Eimeria brunetti]|uniref:Uncharacterized protein n=1 Tax=Eimeria brunetti TaxID=51314 RepID=U6LZP0_9EIME|nr:hypothetical protein, conserved [Eimeria brunetti]
MPALDVLENPSRTEELDGIEGGRTLLEHRTRNAQVGLKLPTQLKNRTHHAQHAHGKGLPDPFSTASICGNLVAAVAEHPEELSPQSALQKKTPCGLNGHCHTEAVGSSGGSGPSNQLHLGSVPLLHGAEPSTQPAHDEAANGLQVGGLELGQLQTEVKENELNKPEHTNLKGWVGDQKVQREEEAPARIRSILSQEELLEPDEKNLDAASSRVAEYITNTQNMGATEANGQFDTATASPGGRILRSKTVTVPVLNASPVPRDIPLRQETTLVHSNHHKNSPPSVDCSRGRRKTGTSVGRQSVRRTQSDARGCLSGDMNLPQTPGGALGTLTEGLYSSRAPQWRGISVPRRSPQRLKEHLITRDTPESSLQYDRPSPSPRSQEGTVEISSDNVYAQERQVSSKDGPEGHMTFSSDSATAGVGERKESCCILLSSGGLSTSHMQVCHGRGCANSGQSHSAKQAAMIRSGERGRASGDRLTSLPSFAIQTTKAARERYKKPHNQVQSFSSQLQKRLRRRSITRRVKCKKGGQEVLLPHRDKKKSHEALCRLGNDDGATAVEQAPINDGVLKNSRRSMCSMEGPKASSPTLKYGLSGDENNPQNKVSEAHIGTGQYTTTVQPLDNHHARSPPPRSSSNSFIASGSLAGGSVRAFRAASNEGDICSKDGPPENVTACKGHPVKVNVSLYSYRTRNRRAASCIEPSLHGVPKLPVNKSAGCSERGSRSLSWSPGGAEDALVLPRQPRKVNVTNREKATRSQLKETPSTENVSYEGRTRSHRRRSVEDPPRLSEAEPTLGSVGPPYEGGKAARIASTFGPTDALPLQADGEAPQQGASASWVTRGRFWNDGRLKTKMLISGISAASSQSPYSQHGQTRSTNGPRQLLLDSQLFGNAATSAQLPHGRGVASGVRPNGIFLGLSMAIPGQCAKLGLTHEAVDVSTEVDGAPYFPGHHIVRHPQSMLLNEGGGRMGLSSNDNASGHPFMDPAGNTKSYLWADPRTSHSDGQGGYTEGKTANGAPNPGNLSGVAANYAEGDTLVHRLSDPQEEAALPSVVQPCPVFPKPLLIRNRTRERDSEKQLTGTSQSECLPNVTTERLPGLRQQPITAKLREETAQENPGISHTGLVSEECVQPTESKVPLQPQQSYTIVARDPPGCLPSPRETSDSSIHPAQGSADKNGNTLKLQLALPQISQPDNPERLGVGQHDPGGPTLPRAASEPACPKVAVGLELSFPSPGIIVSPKGGIDYDGSYSRMEVTLSPSLPIIRSVPIIKLQTKTSAGCDCEGASQGRRTEPSDYSAYVAPCRKCNSMPTTSTLFPSRGNLSRGSRASHIDSLRRGTVIRDGRSRQREDTNAETSSNKAGANPLGEVLRGTPARYRCNAIPMAYHRDPSISVFSQLFEDSFRRQRNLLILRRQKHLESTPGVRPEGTGGGESPQQISMLAARPLSRYDATSRSRETTKVVNKKQTVFRKPGRISGPREALKEKKVHSEISAMPTDGPLDNNGVRRKSLVMGDDAETQLCFHVEALCPAAAQATPHPETSICMHAATSRLEPLPPHTERFGTCLAAIEAESIN